MGSKDYKWWLKTIGEALLWTGGYYATEILQVFPDNTIAHQVAIPVGFMIGFMVRKAIGTKSEYKQDTLPSGLSRVLDKIPNSITGIRGSDNINTEK